MADIKLGIQLYTLRDHIQNAADFESTLQRLQKMGVRVIQISGIGPIDAQEVADIVRKYDMDVCVTHKDFNRMLNDLDTMIDEHKLIDCDCMGIGGMPGDARESAQAVREFIAKATEIGKKMRERGERFCYHNHDFEFKKVDGDKTIMDILLEETDPDLFWFIPDVAWMHYAGVNPAEYLEKMKGRVKVLHFKDYILPDGERKFCSLGKGLVNLEDCYKACQKLGIPYIVYEQDIDWVDNDPFKATEESWEFMKELAAKCVE